MSSDLPKSLVRGNIPYGALGNYLLAGSLLVQQLIKSTRRSLMKLLSIVLVAIGQMMDW